MLSALPSPVSRVVYFFGRLLLHLVMPKPIPTTTSSATSMMIMTKSGAITSCRWLFSGHSAPAVQLKGSRDPVGQYVPFGHGNCRCPFGAPGQ